MKFRPTWKILSKKALGKLSLKQCSGVDSIGIESTGFYIYDIEYSNIMNADISESAE